MTKKQKTMLTRIIVTLVLFIPQFILEHIGVFELIPYRWILVVIALVPYGVIGWDIIKKACVNIAHGQVFDENFLMMVATFGAFGCGEYTEAVAVMLFYQVGELFQSIAVGKSRQSISAMMDIAPEYANIEEDGEIKEVDPDDVEVGSIIIIRPGEKVPLDGVIIEGESMLDTAALTGESVPRKAKVGDAIFSGCVNGNGLLKVETTKEYDDSTVARILELVENASEKKANVENFITRFAKYYTPVVTIGAVLLAVIPPLLSMAGLIPYDGTIGGVWADWVHRACTFLVISCPCALVISVPMGFFGGIGAASKLGVLVKGSNYLEAIADMDTIVFDKTGTLTKGEFKVSEIIPVSVSEEELLNLTAHAEGYSTHPIANSIKDAFGKTLDMSNVSEAEEIAGHGLHTFVSGQELFVGNAKLMKTRGIEVSEVEIRNAGGTFVYVSTADKLLGVIVISDTPKDGAKEALSDMKSVCVKKTVMLSGDNEKAASYIAKELGVDEYHAELLPEDKVSWVEKLLAEETKKAKLAFVGDGINDAPVLTRSDIGFAMGSMGSDAAIEAADVVIMDDDVRKISRVVRVARKTIAIVRQNIVFALGIKLVVLILGALGLASMWAAVFADVGVSVIAIINSMRTLKVKK